MTNPFRSMLLCISLLHASSLCTAQSYVKDPEQFIDAHLRSPAGAHAGAPAVVLYEKGSAVVNSNRTERQVRKVIKVLTAEGAADVGNVVLTLVSARDVYTEVKKIRGATYNLENGKIVKQELKEETVFKSKLTKYHDQVKFSLPNVREGSIIEYSYIIDEPLDYNIDSWTFSSIYPKLYSEFEVSAPKVLIVSDIKQNTPYFATLESVGKKADSLLPVAYRTMKEGHAFGEPSYVQCWVRRNVPAINEEAFVGSMDNHTERIDLQITGVGRSAFGFTFMNTYEKANKFLYESFHFYQPLIKVHDGVDKKTKELTAGLTQPMEKARAIFHFVCNHVVTPRESYFFFTGSDPDEVLKEQQGSRSEANMLLVAMLKRAGLDADPILVSTRDHIRPLAEFPLMNRYNMAACLLTLNGERYFLDASDKYQPFGVMSSECYNGYARIVAEKGGHVVIEPESYRKRRKIFVRTERGGVGDYLLRVSQSFDYDQAKALRAEWSKDSSKVRKYGEALARKCSVPAEVAGCEVKNLHNPDTTLSVDLVLKLQWKDEEKIYLVPPFAGTLAENPFKAVRREYPVEMEGCNDEAYFFQFVLPDGYSVEELPQSEKVILDDKDSYQYLISYDEANRMISVNSRLVMNKAVFQPAEYDQLRALYNKMIQAQNKTIILKKNP